MSVFKRFNLYLVLSVFFAGLTVLPDPNNIEIIKLSPNLYKLTHNYMNMVVCIGRDGVLFSDVMEASSGPKIQNAIYKLGGKEVKLIINTHWHHDHTGGNQYFAEHGDLSIISHPSVREHLSSPQYVTLFDEHYDIFPEYAIPNLTFTNRMTIHFNGEDIEITSLPNGHTKGDLVVYFQKSKVLHIGDLYFQGQFPSIDYERGGNVVQLAKNLNLIVETIPNDVRIVPGHLDDCTIINLKEYRDMLLATTEIVRRAKSQGKTLAEMKQSHILKSWESWGKHVTCDMWIETIFHCLELSDKFESYQIILFSCFR